MSAESTGPQNGKPRPEWIPVYLRALRDTGSAHAAADTAGIDRTTAYRYAKAHPDFAAAMKEARAQSIGDLEKKVHRWALGGYTETTTEVHRNAKGEVTGTTTRRTRRVKPELALAILARRRPERWAQRRNDASTVQVNILVPREARDRFLSDPDIAMQVAKLDALLARPRDEAPAQLPGPAGDE